MLVATLSTRGRFVPVFAFFLVFGADTDEVVLAFARPDPLVFCPAEGFLPGVPDEDDDEEVLVQVMGIPLSLLHLMRCSRYKS